MMKKCLGITNPLVSPIELVEMADFCMLTKKTSYEKCHIIDDSIFSEIYEEIFKIEFTGNDTIDGNIVHLREDFHRDHMDSLNKPVTLRGRRLGFDFLNKVCYAQDFDTNEITEWPWQVDLIEAKNIYLAWSNSRNKSTKKMYRFLKKIDKKLVDYEDWRDMT